MLSPCDVKMSCWHRLSWTRIREVPAVIVMNEHLSSVSSHQYQALFPYNFHSSQLYKNSIVNWQTMQADIACQHNWTRDAFVVKDISVADRVTLREVVLSMQCWACSVEHAVLNMYLNSSVESFVSPSHLTSLLANCVFISFVSHLECCILFQSSFVLFCVCSCLVWRCH